MHLIHIVARNDILILSAQKITLGGVQLAGDIHRLSCGIIQTDGLSDCFANFYYDKEQDKNASEVYGLPEKYILCLSTLEPRKNMRLLVEAFSELTKEKKINTNLVLAGRKGWLMDDLLSNLDKEIVNRIHFTGFVDDTLLPYVYRNAQIFVFPSVYD